MLAPKARLTPWLELIAGVALALRLARWRGAATSREPLLLVLHLGYGWLALGLVLLGLDGLVPMLPETTALHALTVGAIGTMTLAVMTRASLGHTGRALTAGTGTTGIYALIIAAAVLRLVAPLGRVGHLLLLSLSGAAWTGAFGLFVLIYTPLLLSPRGTNEAMVTRTTRASRIQVKRAYLRPAPEDGMRVLVDRLWPRDKSKSDAKIDQWMRELAPSSGLRRWFGHDPSRWEEFRRRYEAELSDKPELLDELREIAREKPLTLVFGARRAP